MKTILKQIHLSFSCCLHCGSFLSNESRLCKPCFDLLQSYQVSRFPNLINKNHRALFHWVPGQSDLLSHLVLSLKGGGSKQAWHHYAKLMMGEYFKDLPEGRRIIVVPAPPSKNGHHDHAYEWGNALTHLLGAELYTGLRKASGAKQRRGDRGERALLRMEAVEINTRLSQDLTEAIWIFADDIVTTGSTAHAAYLALGKPSYFQTWVLAQRSLSCGP